MRKKLYSFVLLAAGLLVGTNALATVHTVGTTGSGATYSTIASAISAASAGDEIQLLTDMTEKFTVSKNLTFSGDKTINGEMTTKNSITITLKGISIINSSEPIINQTSTNLTINISENSVNNLSASASNAAGIAKIYGTLTISGEGTLNVSGNAYGIQVYGTLTIDAPNIKVTGPANNAIYTYGKAYTIKAGTYSNEVTVPAGYACASNGDGTYTVYAGSFLANGQAYQTIAEAVAAVNAGDEIKMVANLAGDCSINKSVIINLNDYNITGTITTDGAEVTLRTHEYDMNATAASTIGGINEINGGKIVFREGTYNFNPEGHLAPDMYSKSYASNSKTIYAVAPHIAQVGSNYYLCLREALNAITTNGEGTITLLHDAVLDAADYSISNKTIIIDFNGHNIDGGTKNYCITMYTNSSLTLTGNGTYSTSQYGVYMYGADAPHTTQTVLNIGKDVVISAVSDGVVMYPRSTSASLDENGNVGTFGVKVFVEGTLASMSSSLNVLGTATSSDDCPEITIAPTAVLSKIYAAGFAKWIMNGGRMSNVFEIRAGELTINDGEISVSADRAITCNPNGSGSTSTGAAVAVAQHNTKQPIVVTINGGTFTAPIAMLQVNPQNNTELDYKKMIVNVNGGSFWSSNTTAGTLFKDLANYGTVIYGDDDMFISQNRRIFVRGGYYNNDPINFVATGYQRIKLTDIPEGDRTAEDNAAIAAGYVYKIGEIQPETQQDANQDGNWVTEANKVWASTAGQTDGQEPTDATPVKIDGKSVVVTTPASAYGIDLGTGTTKLTVKDGGMLMIGAGGVTGATAQNLVVEEGGQVVVAPASTSGEALYTPTASIDVTPVYAHRKADADSKTQSELLATDMYWQHIACPVLEGGNVVAATNGVSILNTWNVASGWKAESSYKNMNKPFVGYNVATSILSAAEPNYNTYTFTGKLVGNTVNPLVFAREGFTFFGNSYLAPIDIRELLNTLMTQEQVEATVCLYNSLNENYTYINRAMLFIPTTPAEIAPLQGFFIYAKKANRLESDYYTKAVWESFCEKAATPVVAAPAREVQNNPFDAMACISLTAADGETDQLYLVESGDFSDAEDNGFDARKMNTNNGLRLAAQGSYADLAVLATDQLAGTDLNVRTSQSQTYTFTFSNVSGNQYALQDMLTGTETTIENGVSYTFTAEQNAELANRFRIVGIRGISTDTKDAMLLNVQKMVQNGRLMIIRGGKKYNALGF